RPRRNRRVHDDAVLALLDEDEEPAEDADLGRGKSDALGLVHERGHALGEAAEIVIVRLDVARLHPQDWVAVLADPGEGDEASRFPLELGVGFPARRVVRRVLVLGVLGSPVLVIVVVLCVLVVVLGHRAASVTTRRATIPASASEA